MRYDDDPSDLAVGLMDVMTAIERVALAIRPLGTLPAEDAAGVYVATVTEAIMGTTAGLVQIANALHDVASAIREAKS